MNSDGSRYIIQQRIKRFFELILSLVGLILLSPVLFAIGLAIALDSKGPALYHQKRIGLNGRPFKVYKFRTMYCGTDDSAYQQYLRKLIDSEKNGQGRPYRKMEEDCRVTRVGKFLRHYYLDELPQLINVLKGEMSLVGPRPHVVIEVNSYTLEQRRRLSVRPGMTGLWQVEGKQDCTFNELIQLDLDYIDHWSLTLDVQLVFKTVFAIIPFGNKALALIENIAIRKRSHKPIEPALQGAGYGAVVRKDHFPVDIHISGIQDSKEKR